MQGAYWTFRYCTTGEEPDPGTDCTSHVQIVKDVCASQLGDESDTNPQQGQTPTGKFSAATQSALWQAEPDTRIPGGTFDVDVTFTAQIANTTANLWNDINTGYANPGCNIYGCGCTSTTVTTPLNKTHTFMIPYPSTVCTK